MPFLFAGLLLVGTLCVLNLLLTLGAIKRLRDQQDLLTEIGSGAPGLALGEEIEEFATLAIGGEIVGRDHITDDTLGGFFSPTCGPCRRELPRFVEYAGALPGGRGGVLAVVVGTEETAAPFVQALAPVARVVVEEPGGEVGAAFRTAAYPTVLRVAPGADGHVVVTADRVDLGRAARAVA
ncbi:hypothetical protein OKJ48_10630 [Streptomyces kunmingensis]|uniref:Thioredoxin domain-containing protein n=1 Tax=Streptomyces kunmingensis TaxID=68225 RepID=A0ABU6C956_9ACTN|nr:hypothetical protein [Streptomyces kunmingensis]MEB3960692.1 hypothetical protein [Streptomyces kunmingensis]